MMYRYLGNTGMRVSVVGYGNWIGSTKESDYELQRDIIKAMHDAGVNFFDSAESYGIGPDNLWGGQAETIMGRAFKELKFRREDLVVSTKLFKSHLLKVNDTFLSRKHIIEGTNNSLKRLQMDYVDVIFAHRPDYSTPLEETCRAFDWLIRQGKAHYWATSEWPADRIAMAMEMCEGLGLHKPICDQFQYSMLVRNNGEKNLRRIFSEYKYGSTVWSPLAMGILTGKYNDGNIPEDSRFGADKKAGANTDTLFAQFLGPKVREANLKKLNALAELAKELDCTQAQLALAWNMANTDISTCILGFSRVAQVAENLKAIDVLKNKWSVEVEKKCHDILGNAPEADMDWRSW